MPRAFDGLRVIDATHVLAGPFAAYQLALLGADVIKIDRPDEPDQVRLQGPDRALNTRTMGTAYLAQGGGKRSLALDLKTEDGRAALLALLRDADVFVQNFRPGALEALGLGYDEVAAITDKVHAGLIGLLAEHALPAPEVVARDLTAMSRGMVHAALFAGETDLAQIERRLLPAILGYLGLDPRG